MKAETQEKKPEMAHCKDCKHYAKPVCKKHSTTATVFYTARKSTCSDWARR